MQASLAISTYQAGKVILLSPVGQEKLIQLPRTFNKAMGIAVEKERLAVACKDEVVLLRNSEELAKFYPKKPNTYDAMYMPRITYHTGALDVHDIDFCSDGIYAVNTNFSCIIKIDEHYNFTPVWKPPFISRITAGDHCHLNGMAVADGKINCVTAFAQTDSPGAWKENLTTTGVLVDYDSKEIINHQLGMPHSPRLINDTLYVLQSATGELVTMDRDNGRLTVVAKYDGFLRGLAHCKGYAFVGISKIRKNSSSFGKLKIADKSNQAGILIIHLETGSLVGKIVYGSSVDEIYDVQILPELMRPSIINTISEDYKQGISIPDKTFWARKNTP